ncbi:hypothetical protein [Streptomyces atratus]
MLTSEAYGTLAKALSALRAHDTIKNLAAPASAAAIGYPSRRYRRQSSGL